MGRMRTKSLSKLRMQKETQKGIFLRAFMPRNFPRDGTPPNLQVPGGIHSKPHGQTHPALCAVLPGTTDGTESSRMNGKPGTGRAQLSCSSSHSTPGTKPAPMSSLFLPGTRRGCKSCDHLVTSLWKHYVLLIGSVCMGMHTGFAIPPVCVVLFLLGSQTLS